jgi:hypothetical protein
LRRRGIEDARLFAGVEFALLCSPGESWASMARPPLCFARWCSWRREPVLACSSRSRQKIAARCFLVYLLLS